MPHVAFVPFTGLRVGELEMLAFGMSLPGLEERGKALGELPALGLLTLAGMLGQEWSCSYHPSASSNSLVADILATVHLKTESEKNCDIKSGEAIRAGCGT